MLTLNPSIVVNLNLKEMKKRAELQIQRVNETNSASGKRDYRIHGNTKDINQSHE